MDILFICAQILGITVFILNIVGNTKMTTKKVYIYNGVCNGLSGIQYVLLGAWSGALCCVIALLRNIVFAKFKKKVPLYVLLIYIAITILLNFKLVNNILDVIPIINIIVYAIALWTKDILKIKTAGLFTCIIGVMYDFNKRAYATVLNELIDGIIAVRCIILLKRRKNEIEQLNEKIV